MTVLLIIAIAVALGALIYASTLASGRKAIDEKIARQNEALEQQNRALMEKNDALKHLHQENLQIIQESQQNKQKILLELNELTQQQQNLQIEINQQEFIVAMSHQKVADEEARLVGLNRSISTLMSSQEEAARAAFSKYCEALEHEYQQVESEYDGLLEALKRVYDNEQDFLVKELAREKDKATKDLETIRAELEKIRTTRMAAIEAQLREEEIKNQATFYTLQLSEADKRDITYLQSIEYNLREARPLRMLIWSTFYRDKVNDLAARIGAAGACGIYKITHIDSGISYIGQAKDIKERWVKEVKEALGIDAPATNKRCNFMREKGIDNFTFEILEKCSIAELNEKEKFYIDLYQTYEFGLNGNKGIGTK